ncbi:hypothetical protein B0H16DRAFT_1744565 [Mycena metata]|uniref:Uncharacterized protein n=1 Tax=Mycena metata TaxID=1033252 RepID=A0AAD7H4X7_9AGAR|nr:hypothetical protein B0H16DRAFT_1744565 [Mycena metata]
MHLLAGVDSPRTCRRLASHARRCRSHARKHAAQPEPRMPERCLNVHPAPPFPRTHPRPPSPRTHGSAGLPLARTPHRLPLARTLAAPPRRLPLARTLLPPRTPLPPSASHAAAARSHGTAAGASHARRAPRHARRWRLRTHAAALARRTRRTPTFRGSLTSLLITLAGGLIQSFLTLQLLGSWQSLRALDAESELDAWKLDGLRVLWGLLAMYLLAAAFVSFVGFFGVVRGREGCACGCYGGGVWMWYAVSTRTRAAFPSPNPILNPALPLPARPPRRRALCGARRRPWAPLSVCASWPASTRLARRCRRLASHARRAAHPRCLNAYPRRLPLAPAPPSPRTHAAAARYLPRTAPPPMKAALNRRLRPSARAPSTSAPELASPLVHLAPPLPSSRTCTTVPPSFPITLAALSSCARLRSSPQPELAPTAPAFNFILSIQTLSTRLELLLYCITLVSFTQTDKWISSQSTPLQVGGFRKAAC